MELSKTTYLSLLRQIKSGIAIDAAKNHTGICTWENGEVAVCGFSLNEYDKKDPFAEYKMRRDFKESLRKIVDGKSYEICIIEDVYGGENFATVRKLLAINTVIDELIFEHVCDADTFYRWSEPVWLKSLRGVYKQTGRPNPKVEVQGILEYLEFPFYLENKDLSESKKKSIYFEDICDASGMLIGAVAHKLFETNVSKFKPIKLSDVCMYYVELAEESLLIKDSRLQDEGFISVDLDTRRIEDSILRLVQQHPDDIMCAFLPPAKLGVFGLKMKFDFHDGEEGYLIFYKK